MKARPSRALMARLRAVKLFLCDVDGVLTDGRVTIGAENETKQFHIRDGLGLRFLQQQGIRVGWISNRISHATFRRAQELRVDFLEQMEGSKVEAAEKILSRTGLAWDEICYVGDDVVDLGVLRRAGVAVAVADAVEEVKREADYITSVVGGHGAIREMVEMILQAQRKWKPIVDSYCQ